MSSLFVFGQPLSYSGVTVDLPEGWYGRVQFRDVSGKDFLLQVANFALPEQTGLVASISLPAGSEDPTKDLSGGDVLVTVLNVAAAQGDSSFALDQADFIVGDLVPRGRSVAQRSVTASGRGFFVDAMFGQTPVDATVLGAVNSVLASAVVASG